MEAVEIGENFIKGPGAGCACFHSLHAPANFLLPGGFCVRGKIVIIFGQVQEDTRQGQALDRRQFQGVFGNLCKHFHLIKIRPGFLYGKRSISALHGVSMSTFQHFDRSGGPVVP